MKITNKTLRNFYLTDLELPDTYHDRITPKVKYLGNWKQISSTYMNETPKPIDFHDKSCDIWLWSDQHIGHKNIIKYTNRPFSSTEEMNEKLIENYLNMVKPNDIVIWCGDVAFTQDAEINKILADLPGYKIHIVGNHDMDRSGKLKNLAMDERHLCYVLDVADERGEFQLLITHYPMDNVPSNCINVHGHIHNNVAHPWNINVCVEHTNYAPIHIDEIIQKSQLHRTQV